MPQVLDDELPDRYKIRDIVDATPFDPANGAVNTDYMIMILIGSLHKELNNGTAELLSPERKPATLVIPGYDRHPSPVPRSTSLLVAYAPEGIEGENEINTPCFTIDFKPQFHYAVYNFSIGYELDLVSVIFRLSCSQFSGRSYHCISLSSAPHGHTLLDRLTSLFHHTHANACDTTFRSPPLDWARNLVKSRRRSEGTELHEHRPTVVEVPFAKGKPRNASAREENKTITLEEYYCGQLAASKTWCHTAIRRSNSGPAIFATTASCLLVHHTCRRRCYHSGKFSALAP